MTTLNFLDPLQMLTTVFESYKYSHRHPCVPRRVRKTTRQSDIEHSSTWEKL